MRVIRAGGEADVRNQSEATDSVGVPGEGLDDLSVLPELDCLVGGAYMDSESVQEGRGYAHAPFRTLSSSTASTASTELSCPFNSYANWKFRHTLAVL